MPARKPSHRRRFKSAELAPDLTPMMNLVTVLIPILLISMVFLKVTTIDAALAMTDTYGEASTEPRLSLKLEITDKGYRLSAAQPLTQFASAGVLKNGEQLIIPTIDKEVSCRPYVGTMPPPRSRNTHRSTCKSAEDSQTFTVYNHDKLFETAKTIKAAYPKEFEIIITGPDTLEYEAITQAMDSTRGNLNSGRPSGYLFPMPKLAPNGL